jgi:hypothetical protein
MAFARSPAKVHTVVRPANVKNNDASLIEPIVSAGKIGSADAWAMPPWMHSLTTPDVR